MVDLEILRRRLDALHGYLERLERFASGARQAFIDDPDVHHLAERYLHLAVESALDIANHLIADAGYQAPETYRDAFAVLARQGNLDPSLAQRLQRWAGFRNILAHAYLAIDHGLVWDAIVSELDDLRRFAAWAAQRL